MGLASHQQYTPLLVESIARLGSLLPFALAAEALQHFHQMRLSASTVRRLTEGIGAVQVELAAHEERAVPETPPRVQVLQSDGAFVRLVGGEWREVKMLVVGVASEPTLEEGRMVVHTTELSYFAQLASVDEFRQAALVELRRRGAGETICALGDGAAWLQGCWECWCPTAVRILDWAHAMGYLAQAGHARYGEQTTAFVSWYAQQRESLLTGSPQRVIDALQQLSLEAADLKLSDAAQQAIDESWRYLKARSGMIQYAAFRALGYPIGSGAVESAHKQILQRRLKGVGMQWSESKVNPMLALTTLTANVRWSSSWPELMAFRIRQARQARLARMALKQPPDPLPPPELPAPEPQSTPARQPHKPAPDHPWRRATLGRPPKQAEAA